MTPWAYWRPPPTPSSLFPRVDALVEFSSVRGVDVGLPAHFHDQDQVTFVIAGRRRFQIGGHLIEIGPGESFVIAAGTPHSSLCEPAGAHCFNAYVGPGCGRATELVDELARHWQMVGTLVMPEIAERSSHAARHMPARVPSRVPSTLGGAGGTVAAAAARAGMSREGFSRGFHRDHGITPRAFQLTDKLNRARSLLRAGLPIAAAAADTGFADQSHLGRCFRRAFGVTPGAYRAGASQSFQTHRPA